MSTRGTRVRIGRRHQGAALALVLLLSISACSADDTDSPQPGASTSVPTSHARPADPLERLTDRDDDSFVATRPDVVLHEQATGSKRFSVTTGPGDTGVQVYVSCSPASDFRVQVVGDRDSFFTGPCEREFQNFGGLPLAGSGGSLELDLSLPQGVRSWVVALPTRE